MPCTYRVDDHNWTPWLFTAVILELPLITVLMTCMAISFDSTCIYPGFGWGEPKHKKCVFLYVSRQIYACTSNGRMKWPEKWVLFYRDGDQGLNLALHWTSWKLRYFSLFYRMAGLSADSGGGDDGPRLGSQENSLRNVAKRSHQLSLPGMGATNTRSLFIFSEENFIRKYARLIIEWGYPFLKCNSLYRGW